ncbi:hypothetical protein O7607_30105 [Micromonospora sp. WMMA1949]|uniref:hypothetical protein n=1 Tax=Micromonospora sp. WMMA1949 TaxID=3015162 RepID=UPI0022B659C2|nr:hypothetical protein [Micromonospora sp. WMMA1949]MCZ7430025.1 hypothetical protein [Micromonospora sp. WMMA1949]
MPELGDDDRIASQVSLDASGLERTLHVLEGMEQCRMISSAVVNPPRSSRTALIVSAWAGVISNSEHNHSAGT